MENRYLYTLKEIIFSIRKLYLDENQKNMMLSSLKDLNNTEGISLFHPNENQVKSLSDNGIITFNTDNISVSSINNSALPELQYLPSSDTLTITESSSDLKVTEYSIEYLMRMFFFYKHFPQYHITFLQESRIKDKKLVLESFEPCSKIKFNIQEEEECIRLTKVPKR